MEKIFPKIGNFFIELGMIISCEEIKISKIQWKVKE